MRILCWNINGIRTLPQYHPWYELKTPQAILAHLNADIICFQEMKIQKTALDRATALPEQFHSFFSFPRSNRGYSGVAIYTNSNTVVPLKAEEGLSSLLQPKPELSADERISFSYPDPAQFNFYAEEDGTTPHDFVGLENEGRALVLDFGLFVLVNVYCPAETSESRVPFKMNYHRLLEERVRILIEDEKREVMVVGDINSVAEPMDHGEGTLESRLKGFWDHPARNWFRQWRSPNGPFVDVIRSFWPDRQGMFTCWNTVLNARESNYGARIDYILVTKGLVPWVKFGDIQAEIRGSDHCPIFIDLHDEIISEDGKIIQLSDVISGGTLETREPPRIAAKFWEVFSGKQTLLSKFFTQRDSPDPLKSSNTSPKTESSLSIQSDSQTSIQDTTPILPEISQPKNQSESQSKLSGGAVLISQPGAKSTGKRKESGSSLAKEANGRNPKKNKAAGQASLNSFFSSSSKSEAGLSTKPGAAKSAKVMSSLPPSEGAIAPSNIIIVDNGEEVEDTTATTRNSSQDHIESDYLYAMSLQETIDPSEEPPSLSPTATGQQKVAWNKLLAPLDAPLCDVHREPAKRFTVNKTGPNKGKTFFVCSRPVGPGYDKGKSERLREEVDPTYRCNFFKWASDVRKDASRG